MGQVSVFGPAFPLGCYVDQKIEPVEIRIVVDQGFDLFVMRCDEVRGRAEEFLHQAKFFFAEACVGENHDALSAFYLNSRRKPVLSHPMQSRSNGRTRVMPRAKDSGTVNSIKTYLTNQ